MCTCREDWWDEAGARAQKEHQRDAGGGVTAQDAKVHLVLFVTGNLEVDQGAPPWMSFLSFSFLHLTSRWGRVPLF